MYHLDNDISKIHLRRTNRYVRKIRNITQQVGILIKNLPLDKCTISTTFQLILSMKPNLHLFMTIMTAINNLSKFVRTAINYIKATEKKFYTKPKNILDNRAKVLMISSYEIFLQVIAENCRWANKPIGSNDLISQSSISIWLPISKMID